MQGLVVFYAICWLGCFMLGLLIDEDLNHWDWPGENGPGARVTAKIAVLSALVATLPLVLLVAFGALVKMLADATA